MAQPSRGEIWAANLSPTRGHEQAGYRPVLIVSTNLFNQGPASLVFSLPLTRTDRDIPFHIPIDPPEGGLKSRSFVLCDAIRSISKERLNPEPWGRVSAATLEKVEDCLRILLEL
ncbi:MAG: type II toxin-antitoxin system PemK/MazF family toxin [Cyanobacteria bacterium P01_A01_bin.17]